MICPGVGKIATGAFGSICPYCGKASKVTIFRNLDGSLASRLVNAHEVSLRRIMRIKAIGVKNGKSNIPMGKALVVDVNTLAND